MASLPVHAVPPKAAAGPHPFNAQIFIGVLGVFVAAMMSGMNNRIGGLSLVDLKGAAGLGADEGSWITSVYAACELAAMPFATWFAVTLSLRRFHLGAVAIFTLLGLLTPYAPSLPVLLCLRALQGFFGGLLIPVLMAAALRFFPLPLRLYGLALYAMTATFSPNVATWLSATYTDTLGNWHLVYWQALPLAAFSLWAVAWGVPQDPVMLGRFRQINLIGLVTGLAGLVMLGLGLSQGERYDWFNDTLICWFFGAGGALLCVCLLTEWYHPLPFIKLQLLERRNLGLGFSIFYALVVILLSGSLLPALFLSHIHAFRTPYVAVLGITVGVPQLVLGPFVSYLLYKRWMDARYMFAGGLLCIAMSCLIASRVTSAWMAPEFFAVQVLQAIGQPMAVVSTLFLATSVVQPSEGPVVSGIVNVLRVLATVSGAAFVERLIVVREHTHANVLLDRAIRADGAGLHADGVEHLRHLAERITHQAFVLSIADAYLVLGLLAVALVPFVLNLHYIAPPKVHKPIHL
ncbi:MFS transporter [Cupriavidus pauculus]|uniref:MFS transporter n=1 Tax=Cupriavidus pauculus TaxID=82633 RepID=UPI001EE1E255|nr:MFS transporter [Cupriavidus pauculus]GJG95069.1 multidrug efflux MFS transporter [Cupriavidus pauculus]